MYSKKLTNAGTHRSPSAASSPGSLGRIALVRKAWFGSVRSTSSIVRMGPYGGYLPDGVFGIDFNKEYQLNEANIELTCSLQDAVGYGLRHGARLAPKKAGGFLTFRTSDGEYLANIPLAKPGEESWLSRKADDLLAGLAASIGVGDDKTVLADYAGCRLRRCDRVAPGRYRLLIHTQFVSKLTEKTAERFALAAGIVTSEQLKSGFLAQSPAMPPKVIDKRARRDDRDDLPDGGPTVAIDVSDDVGPAARRGGHGRPAERAGSAGDARDVSAGGAGPDEHAFLERMEARLDEVKEALDARERELDKRAGRLERQERELHELLQDCRDCERSLSASWDELEKQAKQVRELAQELGSASSRLLKIEDETRRSNAADAARRPAR